MAFKCFESDVEHPENNTSIFFAGNVYQARKEDVPVLMQKDINPDQLEQLLESHLVYSYWPQIHRGMPPIGLPPDLYDKFKSVRDSRELVINKMDNGIYVFIPKSPETLLSLYQRPSTDTRDLPHQLCDLFKSAVSTYYG